MSEHQKPTDPQEEPPTKGHKGVSSEAAAGGGEAARAVQTYQIAIYTGTPPGAGTDGDVWIWFDGTNGRSGWLYCDNSADNFENGQTDYFYFNLPDLGYLQAAWVHFRPSGGSSAWFLANVVINGTYFTLNQWLTTTGTTRLNRA
ncbi:PLAT/LH2 domain-containing protein [Kocuria sp. CPCC 205300]|uniref:PLAT/LH2 domain-containing protein n=1 Tax=Kocuria sabuli TaxID=3071448 RepID=UPI0036D7BD2C